MDRSKQVSASPSPHPTSPAAAEAPRRDRPSARLRGRLGFAGEGSRLPDRARSPLDIVDSLTVLALASPLMLVIAVLIELDSPGPVLFKQVRIGINRLPVFLDKDGAADGP